MILVSDFTKVYNLSKKEKIKLKTKSSKKIAVNNISFLAKEGEIYGLLGPNGAGKTTTLRTITTLLKPSEGKIAVQGFDVVKQSNDVRKKIGFLTNDLKIDPQFTPIYTMKFFGKLRGLSNDIIEERMNMLFDYFGIKEYSNKKISELSTGMTQKLAIVVSLIHDPEVIIFDEPTNGLDIITAKAVTDYLLELKKQGKLIIISTHIMTVAEKLCDRIGILIQGKKVIEGTKEEILSETNSDDLEQAFFRLYKDNIKEEI
jgi:sodium transport system ATP-binding protein